MPTLSPLKDTSTLHAGDVLRHRDGQMYVVVNINPFTAVHVLHCLEDRSEWSRVAFAPGEGVAVEYNHREQQIVKK